MLEPFRNVEVNHRQFQVILACGIIINNNIVGVDVSVTHCDVLSLKVIEHAQQLQKHVFDLIIS